jgi:Zn-dependent protease with chaperone function
VCPQALGFDILLVVERGILRRADVEVVEGVLPTTVAHVVHGWLLLVCLFVVVGTVITYR